MCVRECVCECVRERQRQREGERQREPLVVSLLGERSAGVFVWMCTGGFANLWSSKGKTESEE